MKLDTWHIDSAHSGINFSVRHMVFAKVRGRFGRFRGALRLDPEDLTRSSVEVEIDAGSIDTGVAERDNHLRSQDFLNTADFPKLTFRSTKVESAGPDRYRVHGELTVRDVVGQVTLEVQDAGRAKDPWGNQRAAFSATTSLDRGAYGLQWNQVLETGGVLVGDRIDIELEVQAVHAADSKAA